MYLLTSLSFPACNLESTSNKNVIVAVHLMMRDPNQLTQIQSSVNCSKSFTLSYQLSSMINLFLSLLYSAS